MTITTNPALPGQDVMFDASMSDGGHELFCRYPDIESWEWDLDGNGTYETAGEKVVRTYAQNGIVHVTLRVTNSCASDTESQDLVIGPDQATPVGQEVPADLMEPAVPAPPPVAHPPLPSDELSPNEIGVGDEVGVEEPSLEGSAEQLGVDALGFDERTADQLESGTITLDQAMEARAPTACKTKARGRVRRQDDGTGWQVYFFGKGVCNNPVTIGGQAYLVTPRGSVEDSGNQVDRVGTFGISEGFYNENKRYSHASLAVFSYTLPRGRWVGWSGNCKRPSPARLVCTASSGLFR